MIGTFREAVSWVGKGLNFMHDHRRRSVAVGAGALALLLSSLPLGAQQPVVPPPKTKAQSAGAKKSVGPSYGLPLPRGGVRGLLNPAANAPGAIHLPDQMRPLPADRLPGAITKLRRGDGSAKKPAPAPARAPAPAKTSIDVARREPAAFAQLGLTDKQRESIAKIQGKYAPKIEALQNQIAVIQIQHRYANRAGQSTAPLEKQIADIRAQSLKESEGILTASQKQLLAQKRESTGLPSTKGN
jgi:hypothetical protein